MTSTWFEQAVRPENVAAELRRRVAELVADPARLTGCRIIRLRAGEEDGRWTATYLLDLADRTVAAQGLLLPPGVDPPGTPEGDPVEAQIGAVPFAGDGWSLWLPDVRVLLRTRTSDESIPGLAAMTDPDSALAVLRPVLRSVGPGAPDAEPVGVTTTVAAYKPGVRVTMICDLEYAPAPAADPHSDTSEGGNRGQQVRQEPAGIPGPPRPRAVVVKATSGDEALVLHEAQSRLWDSPLATDPRVRIARPIAHVPDLHLAVQSHLDHERTLKDLLPDAFSGGPGEPAEPDASAAVRATGAALAALHGSGVRHGAPASFEDELATTRRKLDTLAAVVPWLTGHTAGVLDRLADAAAASEPQAPGPSHGSFRTAQVLLLDGGGIGLIDLDKLRQAEPAADVGPFLAKLRHTAVNKGTDTGALPDENTMARHGRRVDSLRETFLTAYEEQGPLSRERVALWEALELVSLVLGSAKKGLTERGASCARMLHAHLGANGL